MRSYQVLFSGEVAEQANIHAVQANLARELGINDAKARKLFSGRTVVLRSQMEQDEALALQRKLADLGALCRVKNFVPKQANFKADTNKSDYTLRDITAAHLECPRCGHMQLDSSHCARCGVDLGLAMKQQRKEDLIIEKKIRELRQVLPGGSDAEAGAAEQPEGEVLDDQPRPRLERVVSWLKGSK